MMRHCVLHSTELASPTRECCASHHHHPHRRTEGGANSGTHRAPPAAAALRDGRPHADTHAVTRLVRGASATSKADHGVSPPEQQADRRQVRLPPSLPGERAGHDGVSAIVRELYPVPTADRVSSCEGCQQLCGTVELLRQAIVAISDAVTEQVKGLHAELRIARLESSEMRQLLATRAAFPPQTGSSGGVLAASPSHTMGNDLLSSAPGIHRPASRESSAVREATYHALAEERRLNYQWDQKLSDMQRELSGLRQRVEALAAARATGQERPQVTSFDTPLSSQVAAHIERFVELREAGLKHQIQREVIDPEIGALRTQLVEMRRQVTVTSTELRTETRHSLDDAVLKMQALVRDCLSQCQRGFGRIEAAAAASPR